MDTTGLSPEPGGPVNWMRLCRLVPRFCGRYADELDELLLKAVLVGLIARAGIRILAVIVALIHRLVYSEKTSQQPRIPDSRSSRRSKGWPGRVQWRSADAGDQFTAQLRAGGDVIRLAFCLPGSRY